MLIVVSGVRRSWLTIAINYCLSLSISFLAVISCPTQKNDFSDSTQWMDQSTSTGSPLFCLIRDSNWVSVVPDMAEDKDWLKVLISSLTRILLRFIPKTMSSEYPRTRLQAGLAMVSFPPASSEQITSAECSIIDFSFCFAFDNELAKSWNVVSSSAISSCPVIGGFTG